jgi:hypothetical protein
MPLRVRKRCPSRGGDRRERRCRGCACILAGGIASGWPVQTRASTSSEARGRRRWGSSRRARG